MKDHLESLRNGEELSLKSQLSIIIKLSIPAILAQISSIVMQYIDAAMVGRLGTQSSASIGLVSTTTWLIGGLINALAIGFNVQVAHKIGAGDDKKARSLVRHGLLTVVGLSLIISILALSIKDKLPLWLGAESAIVADSVIYFTVFAVTIPIMGVNYSASGMLQCSGNMKLPSALSILKCFLDIVFNYILIFPAKNLSIFGIDFSLPGFGLGVLGAALGTSIAEAITALLMLVSLLMFSDTLKLRREKSFGRYDLELKKALRIAAPIGLESFAMGLAYVASTKIVAPLGSTSITAHSFSITAESLCYMPGYGIGVAATTIIGQVIGAGNGKAAKKMSRLTVLFVMGIMTAAGVFMYIFAPQMIGLLSPDPAVRRLGAQILRIEAFAEPFYAASIVISGVFRGLGDTFVPSIINLISMWALRIPLSAALAQTLGLRGVWIAMAAELTARGAAFLIRLFIKTYRKELRLNDRASDKDLD